MENNDESITGLYPSCDSSISILRQYRSESNTDRQSDHSNVRPSTQNGCTTRRLLKTLRKKVWPARDRDSLHIFLHQSSQSYSPIAAIRVPFSSQSTSFPRLTRKRGVLGDGVLDLTHLNLAPKKRQRLTPTDPSASQLLTRVRYTWQPRPQLSAFSHVSPTKLFTKSSVEKRQTQLDHGVEEDANDLGLLKKTSANVDVDNKHGTNLMDNNTRMEGGLRTYQKTPEAEHNLNSNSFTSELENSVSPLDMEPLFSRLSFQKSPQISNFPLNADAFARAAEVRKRRLKQILGVGEAIEESAATSATTIAVASTAVTTGTAKDLSSGPVFVFQSSNADDTNKITTTPTTTTISFPSFNRPAEDTNPFITSIVPTTGAKPAGLPSHRRKFARR